MTTAPPDYLKALPRDLASGVVVFLVALPLCLGIALASDAPLLSGLIAGIVGGLVISWTSGSHTSVSGPAAGLTAIVAAQIANLGSFEGFLVAVVLAGFLQIGLGLLQAGALGAFFPNSVIKGLLSAIGIILILKQIPHLFGNDADWLGDLSFVELDGSNTFTHLADTVSGAFHLGATAIGLASLALLVVWDRTPLKRIPVPAPLVVVLLGVAAVVLGLGDAPGGLRMTNEHLVQVPVSGSVGAFFATLPTPDLSVLSGAAVWTAAVTIALVASLETLLNLEAVDKLDHQKRHSPRNRELLAQGTGNVVSGLLGGLPVTSVIVRSSVNIASGGQTRMAAFIHGVLLLSLVLLVPNILNLIPLPSLAAVLLVTGFKLATPRLFKQMWNGGSEEFLPFIGTITAIVLTDLLIGIGIGLAIALVFILRANLGVPVEMHDEQDLTGDITRIQLPSQVSFLNRAALRRTLERLDPGRRVLFDARNTTYIDPDVLDTLNEFEVEIAPARDIEVGTVGFEHRDDQLNLAHVATPEIQESTSPDQVLQLLRAGNERFASDHRIVRDRLYEVRATAGGQSPLACILACMDSRISTEEIFDAGLGDLFSVRVAGNIVTDEALGSMEYAAGVAGAKLIFVLGHKRCGAVAATVDQVAAEEEGPRPPSDGFLPTITGPIAESVTAESSFWDDRSSSNADFVDRVAELNVRRAIQEVRSRSADLRKRIDEGELKVAGGIYDVESGQVEFLNGR